MSIIFYNYFENITDKFYMSVKHSIKIVTISFQYGSYNVSDINQIINDTIQEKFNITEQPITISVDVNRYAILIIVEENWELQLDRNFMNLLGFSNSIISEGYNRSLLIPDVDKVKFLKIYCNLVDNREDNEFLTNFFIKGDISQQVTYENDNIYKSKKILNSTFNYIEICIKDQNNKPVNMKDFFQISVYFLKIYMKRLEKIFEDLSIQLNEEKLKYRTLKICKYSFEISKICILSLSTGLTFINAFAIIS